MSLRERLRRDTRLQHERLEASLDLLRDDFTQADLVRLVEQFYGYYGPCETQLDELAEPLRTFLASRVKTPLLANDLRDFGHTSQSLAALPRCDVFCADTAGLALGRWYVLEGSTLGGQLLVRHFRARFDCGQASWSFFESYGPQVGPMWQAYCRRLDEVADTATQNEVIHGANQTFTSLAEWLAQRMT